MRMTHGCWSELQAEIHSMWHSTWNDTLWIQISKTALESHFEEHAQEVWMHPEMQTTLLNTYLNESDQLHSVEETASPVPVNGGYLPEDHALVAKREEIDWVHSEGVYEIVPMQECRYAGMKPLELIWLDTDKSVDPTRKKIRSRLCAREYITNKQGKIQRALNCSLQCHMSQTWCLFVGLSGGNHWSWDTTKSADRISKGQPETQFTSDFRRGSSEIWRRQSWQIGQDHVWNSRRFPHLATWLCESDLKRQTQRSIV